MLSQSMAQFLASKGPSSETTKFAAWPSSHQSNCSAQSPSSAAPRISKQWSHHQGMQSPGLVLKQDPQTAASKGAIKCDELPACLWNSKFWDCACPGTNPTVTDCTKRSKLSTGGVHSGSESGVGDELEKNTALKAPALNIFMVRRATLTVCGAARLKRQA